MNILFYIIGTCVLVTAIINGTIVDTSIHQIYVQLQYLAAIFLIGFGHLFTCINNLKKTDKEPKKLPSEEEKKEFEKQQMESINKAAQFKPY